VRRSQYLLLWIGLLAIISSICSIRLWAKDPEFNLLVNHIESSYQVKRTHIPFLWLAKPFIRGSGIKGLQLAIFENHNFYRPEGGQEFEKFVQRTIRPEWQPMVRVHSRRSGELTCIYVREEDNNFKMLIVTLERDEAVVMQMKLHSKDMRKWLEEPVAIGRKDGNRARMNTDDRGAGMGEGAGPT
jgi:hypothetical protein